MADDVTREVDFVLNGHALRGSRFDVCSWDVVREGEVVLDFLVPKQNEALFSDLSREYVEMVAEMRRIYENRRLMCLPVKGTSISEIDLRQLKNHSPSVFIIKIDDREGAYAPVYVWGAGSEQVGGQDIGTRYRVKMAPVTDILMELYRAKGLHPNEGMAKLHVVAEMLASSGLASPTTNFRTNLEKSSLSDDERSLLKGVKNITGIFAHGNTSTDDDKKAYVRYFQPFFSLLESLINKYR